MIMKLKNQTPGPKAAIEPVKKNYINNKLINPVVKPELLTRLMNSKEELGWLSRYSDRLQAGRSGFDSRQGQDTYFSLLHTVHSGGPPSRLFNG
jgi:hypothetical protein